MCVWISRLLALLWPQNISFMKHFPSLSDSALKESGIDYINETDDETTAKGYGRRKYTDGELQKLSVKLIVMVRQMN